MAENSKIQWCTHTLNTHWGCTKVSEGCQHCYADSLATRYGHNVWGPTAGRRPMSESYWAQLDKWQRQAAKSGETIRVFCNSMSDLFEGPETCQDPAAYAVVRDGRERLFDDIERTPNLTYLLLTKRPENVLDMTPVRWRRDGFPPNVWMGTSVENQARADERIPHLLKIPAAVRFLSAEPLLGPVSLFAYDEDEAALRGPGVIRSGGTTASTPHEAPEGYDDSYPGIDWVIVGGESGPGARPCNLSWVRSLVEQCRVAGVACFVKQLGSVPVTGEAPMEWGRHDSYSTSGGDWLWHLADRKGGDMAEWPECLRVRQFPEVPHD